MSSSNQIGKPSAATTPPFVAHCQELMASASMTGTAPTARRMFGGWGLRLDGLFVALIAFERLYLKVDDNTKATFEQAGCEPFVYGGIGKAISLSYWTVPEQALDSADFMRPWARMALQAALATQANKPKPKPRLKPKDAAKSRPKATPKPPSSKTASLAKPAQTKRVR